MLRAVYTSGECLDQYKKLRLKEIPLAWIDLMNPSKEEEDAVEELLQIKVPSRADVNEIEQSSRLYQQGQAIYLTASLPVENATKRLDIIPITFILIDHITVTVRYDDCALLNALVHKPGRLQLHARAHGSAFSSMNSLLDILIDYLADVLEKSISEVSSTSKILFSHSNVLYGTSGRNGHRDFSAILMKIGIQGDALSAIRDSLLSWTRLAGFLNKRTDKLQFGLQESLLSTVEKDLASISDHAFFVANKIAFLLDATLGMVNIEQNMIIKALSVAATVFLPPTLLATIWGMNYAHMPELSWTYGYPFAILCLALSSIAPYWFFKRKSWL